MVKRAGGMAQAVEHLPSKCKTLNSNPGTTEKMVKTVGCRNYTWD
jgi:hypothetical protein